MLMSKVFKVGATGLSEQRMYSAKEEPVKIIGCKRSRKCSIRVFLLLERCLNDFGWSLILSAHASFHMLCFLFGKKSNENYSLPQVF